MARNSKYDHSTVVVVADDGSSPVGTNEWNAGHDESGMEGYTESTKTIATGKITPTDSVTIVAAESASSDDLDLITYSETAVNDKLYLFADTGDTITVRHNQSPGAGEAAIITTSAANVTLSETVPLVLMRRGTTYYQIVENTVGDADTANGLDQFAATTSAELAGVISDETGSGALVFATSPTFVTPALGTPASGTMTNVTGTSGITGLGTQTQDLEMGGFNVQNGGVIFLAEQASADADATGEGQIWVKTATPNELYFTDDAGTDFQLASKTGTHAAIEFIAIAVSDETTALTTGTAKATFRMPYAFTLTDIRASVTTAPTTSGTLTVDVNDGGTTIMSTNKLTIDVTEKTTETAATPPVLTDTALANDAEITIDIDAISGGATEAGLKVYLIGYQT